MSFYKLGEDIVDPRSPISHSLQQYILSKETMDVIKRMLAEKLDDVDLSYEDFLNLSNFIEEGSIHPTQFGAVIMLLNMKEMNLQEASAFIRAFAEKNKKFMPEKESGRHVVDFWGLEELGDKISIILIPALAACGLIVPKVYSPNIENEDGTLFKLSKIHGFQSTFEASQLAEFIEETNCCIAETMENIVPFETMMRNLCEITMTHQNKTFIAACLILRCLAIEASAVSLILRCSPQNICKTVVEGKQLARYLLEMGRLFNIKVIVILINGFQLIPCSIGSVLELSEAINCLNGKKTNNRLMNCLCIIGGHILASVGQVESVAEGYNRISYSISSGEASKKFGEMISNQGVDGEVVKKLLNPDLDPYKILCSSRIVMISYVQTDCSGYVYRIEYNALLKLFHKINTVKESDGRDSKKVSAYTGFHLLVQVGSKISARENWIKVYHETISLTEKIMEDISKCLVLKTGSFDKNDKNLIHDIIF